MKILIGYDGSTAADAALQDLRRAGLPPEVEAVVLTIADVWGPPGEPAGDEPVRTSLDEEIRVRVQEFRERLSQAVTEARTLAETAGGTVRAMFPSWEVRAEGGHGAPAWELIARADEWRPDLVVVGSHGRSAVVRLILGSVSHRVLNETHCSVRIARQPRVDDDSPVRVIIGVDGSPHAEAAVRAVAARAWPQGGKIRLVAADDPRTHVRGDHVVPPLETTARAASELLRAKKLDVSHALVWGDARRVLLKEAKEWNADCIFVGARGLRRFRLGSVSSDVAAQAHCSVEVVRTSETS